MSAIATPRRPDARPRTTTTAAAPAGRAPRLYHDRLRLRRWVDRRNDLLLTIAAAISLRSRTIPT